MVQIKMVADQTMSSNKTLLKNFGWLIFEWKDVVMSVGLQVITDCSTFRNLNIS